MKNKFLIQLFFASLLVLSSAGAALADPPGSHRDDRWDRYNRWDRGHHVGWDRRHDSDVVVVERDQWGRPIYVQQAAPVVVEPQPLLSIQVR